MTICHHDGFHRTDTDLATCLRTRLEQAEDKIAANTIDVNKAYKSRDEVLVKWHAHQKNVPCPGCQKGHDTFWKSVIESPQWVEWEKATAEWDTAECAGCGHISAEHFQAFLKFCVLAIATKTKQRSKAKKCGHGPDTLKVTDLYCDQCVEEAKS